MKQPLYYTVALIVAIIIVFNLVGDEYYFRLDLTEDHQYTLSDATREILENLEDPVTVKAYFSENLPPVLMKVRRDFQDMLVEYEAMSDGMLVFEFIDPLQSEIAEQEAAQKGVQSETIQVREDNEAKVQRAYFGAVVAISDKQEAIPRIAPGMPMEYALSAAIKKIAIKDKPVIGFVRGHGEAHLAEMAQLKEELDILYNAEEVAMTDSTTIPDRFETLAIIRPTESISPVQLTQLDDFLGKGGRLLVAMNTVTADMQSRYGTPVQTGLPAWLAQKGLVVDQDFVVDQQCGAVSVPQQLGFLTVQTQVQFPFIPVITEFADHPITSGLEAIMMEFASSLHYEGDAAITYTPLLFSSALSDTLNAPQYFDFEKEWTEEDFTQSAIPMAAALEGKLGHTETTTKMVVVTDGDFVVNGGGQRGPQGQQTQGRPLIPDNVYMMANALGWLYGDAGLNELRTKGTTSRPIRELKSGTQNTLKYGNFLLPLLLAIGYGIVRSQKNRAQRNKRRNENYEKA